MTVTRSRLAATDRRAAIVDAALSGVLGPHVRRRDDGRDRPRRRRDGADPLPPLRLEAELFLACLDEVWRRLREAVEEEIAAEPDPAGWVLAVPRAITSLRRRRLAPTQLWLHALSEATDDEEIRRHFRRHLREVHDYVAAVLRRAQAAGAIDPTATSRPRRGSASASACCGPCRTASAGCWARRRSTPSRRLVCSG